MELKTKNFIFFFVFIIVLSLQAIAEPIENRQHPGLPKTISFKIGDTLFLSVDELVTDSIIKKVETQKEKNKKKFVSALFAFPFPLGFMGAHRVMLGTKPWVPVVYVATFGGCFGILPLIDFFVIVFSKDIEEYENNPNIFMWLK